MFVYLWICGFLNSPDPPSEFLWSNTFTPFHFPCLRLNNVFYLVHECLFAANLMGKNWTYTCGIRTSVCIHICKNVQCCCTYSSISQTFIQTYLNIYTFVYWIVLHTYIHIKNIDVHTSMYVCTYIYYFMWICLTGGSQIPLSIRWFHFFVMFFFFIFLIF